MDANPVSPSAPAPASAGHGGDWARRVRESVWAPVAVKAAGIFGGMLALAAIGAASTLAGSSIAVSAAARPGSSTDGVWLAPDHDEHRMPTPASGAVATTPGVASEPDPAPSGSGATPSATAPSPPDGAGRTADGKIILNAATADDLMKLPRVGAKRARAILELRQKVGHFRQITDLLRVRGIGRKTLKLMLPLLVLDAPVSGGAGANAADTAGATAARASAAPRTPAAPPSAR